MKCFKMFGLLFASLAMLAMVGCGGGGGGSSSPATQNPTLNVSIPGGPFQQTTASFRAVQIADELVVKVEAYEKGVKKSSGIEDRKATYNKNRDEYECSITVLPGVEYRLIAYLNDKPVLSNQISASKVQNNATITIDATTTLKTQVYDKWKDSSSNKSFSNFVKNCEKKGIDIDKPADIATLSGVSTTDFETELKKVANNDKSAQLPEVKTIDVSKIGTEDLETSGDKPTSNDVVDKLLAASWKDTTESEVSELFSYYNGKTAKIIYSYDGEKWVNPTDDTYMVYFKRPDNIHLWHFYVGNKPSNAEIHMHNDIWDIYHLKLNKNKTLDISSYKFKKATVGNKVYLKAEDVNSNNVLDSIFMEQVNIPTDLKASIDELLASL